MMAGNYRAGVVARTLGFGRTCRAGRIPWLSFKTPRIDRSSSKSGQCGPKGEDSITASLAATCASGRGFPTTRKPKSSPLRIFTKTRPRAYEADKGWPVKVLMPFRDDKGAMLAGKLLRPKKYPPSSCLRIPTATPAARSQKTPPRRLCTDAHATARGRCCKRKSEGRF